MIKNINDLKNIQIVCRNKQDIENCLNMLEELGFEVRNNDNQYKVIFYREYSDMFENDIRLECKKDTYFFNKKFIKILKKLINEKKEKKEKVEDIEVASDGRVMEINNYKCKECLSFLAIDFNNENIDDPVGNANETLYCNYDSEEMGFYRLLKYGLLFKNDEALDRHLFKLEIETKLKNIAERLNNGRKIDWEDKRQSKFSISYDFIDYKKIYCSLSCHYKSQGTIYCLDKHFLDVAKKEIGEENLIKYFKENFN